MAIQFPCTQCGQPIEVDDEHAGKTAACPYCQAHVAVPLSSTYAPEQSVSALPPTPPPPGMSEVPSPAPVMGPMAPQIAPARPASSRAWGNYALVCTVLVIGLFAAGMVRGYVVAIQAGFSPTSAPSAESWQQLQQRTGGEVVAPGLYFGSLFFAVVGLVLGIVSVVQSVDWRGILAIVICGLFMLCVCGIYLVAAAMLVAR